MTETPAPTAELLERACRVAATGAPFLYDERMAFAWLASALPALLADRARLEALQALCGRRRIVQIETNSTGTTVEQMDHEGDFFTVGRGPGLRDALDQLPSSAAVPLPCSESADTNG